ncbi:MAG: DNA repair protein RecN [Clostridia bacterium]|nr:DNA repair protein RecN [Clostridia bacterium]
MLTELTIENIAVIEKTSICFGDGFNCLTGETGAGKSIIIDAVNCVTGEKTSRELIRSGEKSASVTAVFTCLTENTRSLLSENEIDPGDGELIVFRRIYADGKNSCRVNDRPVSVAFLKSLGDTLINIHGQSDSRNLLDSDKHFEYIDMFAQNSALLAEYRKDFDSLNDIRREIRRLSADESKKLKELDMLDFQIAELQGANLREGEKDELTSRRDAVVNAGKTAAALNAASAALDGDEETPGASDLVAEAAVQIEKAAEYIPALARFPEQLREMGYILDEASSEIVAQIDANSYSEDEINQIEERLDKLYKLSIKYGSTEREMIEYLDEARRRKNEIETADERLEELNGLFDIAAAKAKQSAKKLSHARRDAAKRFAEGVREELTGLDMPNALFAVADELGALDENGVDNMCFLFSANRGEEPKPLTKTASGGELSRVMLAIKNVLSGRDGVATLIFDEIDTGISGRAAGRVAEKLYGVSQRAQVICVTHLAQIASFADHHYLIEKAAKDERTFTSVTKLDEEGRATELARIGSGTNLGALQLENARDMLRRAEEFKAASSAPGTE